MSHPRLIAEGVLHSAPLRSGPATPHGIMGQRLRPIRGSPALRSELCEHDVLVRFEQFAQEVARFC
jgi:hypothetical protein